MLANLLDFITGYYVYQWLVRRRAHKILADFRKLSKLDAMYVLSFNKVQRQWYADGRKIYPSKLIQH